MNKKKTTLIVAVTFLIAVLVFTFVRISGEKDVIKVGYMKITAHAPLIAAYNNNIFDNHNIKVVLEVYPNTPALINAIEAKRIDVAFQVTPDLAWTSAKSNLLYIYFIAQSTDKTPIDGLYAMHEITKDSLIGKTIGCFPGPTAKAMTEKIIYLAYGLTIDEYKLVEVQPPIQLSKLEKGEIELLFTYEPLGALAQERIKAIKIIDAPVEKYIVNPWNGGIGIFSDDFVKYRKDVAIRFQDAIIEGNKFLNSSPDISAQTLIQLQPGLTHEIAVKVPLQNLIFSKSTDEINAINSALERQLEIYKDLHIIDGEVRHNLKVFSAK
ncbi:MAG: ABC transporter substrate-binding protein [Prolixibacteraceae bacterium]|nr:ABC transporter substrate-binding protein [Prolixibacteraceae bacterium]